MALPKVIAANKFAIAVAAVACAGLVLTFPVAITGTTSVDRFGVKQIYPTKPGGREWSLNATDPRDGFVISPAASELFPMPGGSWQIGRETASPNTGLRMYVISEGWRDVEMTGYVKLESHTFDEEFAWAVRSGKHTSTNPCDGTAYYGALSFAGKAWFQKEVVHIDGGYTAKRLGTVSVDPLQDRWVGIKMIAYNVGQAVKLELWVDDRADNNWTKVAETTDDDGWSSDVGYCGRETDHVISEPRPRVVFRVDNATFEFKNLSVREIEPKCYTGAIPFCI
jgi:hypothetical protein